MAVFAATKVAAGAPSGAASVMAVFAVTGAAGAAGAATERMAVSKGEAMTAFNG
jgi:hypothetical protein